MRDQRGPVLAPMASPYWLERPLFYSTMPLPRDFPLTPTIHLGRPIKAGLKEEDMLTAKQREENEHAFDGIKSYLANNRKEYETRCHIGDLISGKYPCQLYSNDSVVADVAPSPLPHLASATSSLKVSTPRMANPFSTVPITTSDIVRGGEVDLLIHDNG
jgi:hypothetical protein